MAINPYGQIDPYGQQHQTDYSPGGGAAAAASAGPGGASAAAYAGPGGAAAAASAGGGQTAVATAGGMDQAKLDPETRLQQAGDQFGQALQGLSPKEKQDMRMLKQFVSQWADQMRSQGMNVDKASLFAFVSMLYANQGLQQNPQNEGLKDLFKAGGNFVGATYDAVQMDQQRAQYGIQ